MSYQELVDNMERVWRSIAGLCGPFTELAGRTLAAGDELHDLIPGFS